MFVQPIRPHSEQKHSEARRLRAAGMPVRRIAAELGLSQSTVSVWTRDIKLTPEQRAANMKRTGGYRGEAWRELSRRKRLEYQMTGRERARSGETLHVAGCMLYWAEGSKGRNTVQFANSDPAMMDMFMRFLRGCFSLTSEDVSFRLNVYTSNGRTIEQIEDYWIGLLGLSRRCARKHVLNHFPTSSSGRRPNKLPNGVCTLRVSRSTWLLQHIYGAIQEYSGIDQPLWLDGPERKPRPR